MNELLLKEKYRILKKKVKDIQTDLQDFEQQFSNLKRDMKKGLLLDNQVVSSASVSSIQKENEALLEEILYQILPSIHDKI